MSVLTERFCSLRSLNSPYHFLSSVALLRPFNKKFLITRSTGRRTWSDLKGVETRRFGGYAYIHEQSATFANRELLLKSYAVLKARTRRGRARKKEEMVAKMETDSAPRISRWFANGTFLCMGYTLYQMIYRDPAFYRFFPIPRLCVHRVKVLFSHFRVGFWSSSFVKRRWYGLRRDCASCEKKKRKQNLTVRCHYCHAACETILSNAPESN